MGVTGPNVLVRPLMELFVEPGAIRTASRRPQRVNPLPTVVPAQGQQETMFFHTL
jgi:hypothetical protein